MSEKCMRGVYACRVNGEFVYMGSTRCGLELLAHNHRNWKNLYGESGRTKFRTELTENPDMKDNEFVWIIPPKFRTQQEVEELEGECIRKYSPLLNVDMDPVRSSKKYGRY